MPLQNRQTLLQEIDDLRSQREAQEALMRLPSGFTERAEEAVERLALISERITQIDHRMNYLRNMMPPETTPRSLEDETRPLREGEIRCDDCENIISEGQTRNRGAGNGTIICNACRIDYFNCARCDRFVHQDDGYSTYDSDSICGSCEENYRSCERCGDRFDDDVNEEYCPSHRETESSSVRNRHYYEGNNSLIGKPFECVTLQSARKFGIELELVFKDSKKGLKASTEIMPDIGIAYDGSISGWGYELQFPPMAGKPAENLIMDTCLLLKDHTAEVNKSTGFHVHIDVADIDMLQNPRQIMATRNIWLFYIAYEDVLLSFLPPSRRTSRYCKNLRSDYHFKEIADVGEMEGLERIWYRVTNRNQLSEAKGDKKHSTRYRGINMHTLFSQRHIEIRYHSGTVNPRKILEWVNLHTRVMDKIISSPTMDVSFLHQANANINLNEKTDSFFNFLGLSAKSENYFRTRQLLFSSKTKTKKIDRREKKIVSDLLTSEEVEA